MTLVVFPCLKSAVDKCVGFVVCGGDHTGKGRGSCTTQAGSDALTWAIGIIPIDDKFKLIG